MAESADKGGTGVFDELDAFFTAAASSDPDAMQQMAANLSTPPERPGATTSGKSRGGNIPKPESGGFAAEAAVKPAADIPLADFAHNQLGKFIAIEPVNAPPGFETADPFILIPANIHSFMPWWGWVTILASLMVLIVGITIMPIISLNRLADRLGGGDQAQVQAAMQQLVLSGNRRTIGKLYEMAVSPDSRITTRLRAIDTLSLIPAPNADQALLRLELSGNTEELIREAATAARKQRLLNRNRVRYR